MGSKASSWLFSSSSASISASGVPARAESTSSAGSYSVTPLSSERSRVRSVWLGRPKARLVPCPASSSAFSLPSAQRTASPTSFASRGFSVSAITQMHSFRRPYGGLPNKGRHDFAGETAQLVHTAGNREQHIGNTGIAQCFDHANNFVGRAVKRVLFRGARFVGVSQYMRSGFCRRIARNIDGASGVFSLTHPRGLLVGTILRHVELARDRYLHRIEHAAACFAFGFVNGNALAERRRRSVLVENEIEPAGSGTPDRMWVACGDPQRRMGPLRRWRLNDDILEVPETALVRKAFARGPGACHHFDRFLEARFGLLGCNLKSLEFAVAVTLADAKIEAATGQQIERRRLFGQQYRIVPRRHDPGRAKPQGRGAHGRGSEQHQRGGHLVPAAEMVFDRKA